MVPAGPFSPFASRSFINLDLDPVQARQQRETMERIVNRVDAIAEEEKPDLQEQRSLANEMREADRVWRSGLLRMRNADDFQTQELYKFTEAHLSHLGVSLPEVENLAVWQADVLEAFGNLRMPPPAPVDPASDAALQLRGVLDSLRLGGAHSVALDLWQPSETMASPVVQDELRQLEQDHDALIQMGQGYGSFDSAGKLLYLDQMQRIEERWEVFMSRFQLMGEQPPPYVSDTEGLLERLGLTSQLALKVLQDAHEAMRADAERLA